MPRFHRTIVIIILLLAFLLLSGTASAAGIQAYMGDTIPLSGYSPSSPSVYLFLTGPNLPVNGVALNDITKRADEGGFTVVSVAGEDDRWSYNWHTSAINGRLDEGTYTVWVVNGPNDRSNLQNAEYGTISVTFSSPTISITTQAQPGSLVISSLPNNASIVVNGQYRGKTPLTLDNLDPGTYTVNISKFGFSPSTATTNLQSGERQEITATLPAETGSLIINTTPPGARVMFDNRDAGLSPATLADLAPGNHTITITKDGYTPSTQQVKITAGTAIPVNVVLSPSSPFSALPMKTPGLTQVTLLALCAAAATVGHIRSRSR
ncbi:MAG: PEGA domain-containing protein [Methanoregula sp.]|jgi:hypothetical protein|uniref:PEGA domain-containing protein n=1 Tax=Methanoregula sp. TaxID=2052170 RepID=UPI003C14E08C